VADLVRFELECRVGGADATAQRTSEARVGVAQASSSAWIFALSGPQLAWMSASKVAAQEVWTAVLLSHAVSSSFNEQSEHDALMQNLLYCTAFPHASEPPGARA
jgi:hypothetical protein